MPLCQCVTTETSERATQQYIGQRAGTTYIEGVDRYDIALDTDFDAFTFAGDETITVEVPDPLAPYP